MKNKFLALIMLFNYQVVLAEWKTDVTDWREARVKSLERPHGWLSLIGMEWFKRGTNSIGSAETNDIVLPHGPKHVGDFILGTENKIQFKPNSSVLADIKVNDEEIADDIDVKMDTSGEPSVFLVDSFQFYVIERGKPALRIKDSKAETLKNFKGIEYFPLDEKYNTKAEFVAYEPHKDVEIINVLGLLSKDKSPGYLKFNIDGEEYRLDTLDAGDDYYLIFADRTSGRTTYGPGRFLYAPKADESGKTTINFHKSYNPPCAFTDYSTCPLPPPQNRIRVFVNAGEKKYY